MVFRHADATSNIYSFDRVSASACSCCSWSALIDKVKFSYIRPSDLFVAAWQRSPDHSRPDVLILRLDVLV